MTANRYEINEEIYITDFLSENDIPSWVKYLNNPTIYANTLIIPYPYTEKDGEDFLQLIKSSSSDSMKYFVVRLKINDELIGACELTRSATNQRRGELGYWLAEPFWHRGLMPKIVRKVIEIARADWKDLVRVEGDVFSFNKASARVLEKCGFVFEGTLRKFYYKNGEDVDGLLYSLIF